MYDIHETLNGTLEETTEQPDDEYEQIYEIIDTAKAADKTESSGPQQTVTRLGYIIIACCFVWVFNVQVLR